MFVVSLFSHWLFWFILAQCWSVLFKSDYMNFMFSAFLFCLGSMGTNFSVSKMILHVHGVFCC